MKLDVRLLHSQFSLKISIVFFFASILILLSSCSKHNYSRPVSWGTQSQEKKTISYSQNNYSQNNPTSPTVNSFESTTSNSQSFGNQNQNKQFLGNLNANKYDPNSVSNPYGKYGSKYSPDSINNKYGKYGNKYSNQSVNNPYATDAPKLYNSQVHGKAEFQ
jgi:hypothetical protein